MEVIMKKIYCTVCGGKIQLTEITPIVYCPVCSSKISAADIENLNFSKEALERISASALLSISSQCVSSKKEYFLNLAEEKGSVAASLELGHIYFRKALYSEALPHYEKAYCAMDPDGVYWYAYCCSLMDNLSFSRSQCNEIIDALDFAIKNSVFNSFHCINLKDHYIDLLNSIPVETAPSLSIDDYQPARYIPEEDPINDTLSDDDAWHAVASGMMGGTGIDGTGI